QEHGEVGAEFSSLDVAAKYESRLIRQLGAKHNQIGPPSFQLALGFGAIFGERSLVAGAFEDGGHAEGKIVLVFDDEYSTIHGALGQRCRRDDVILLSRATA